MAKNIHEAILEVMQEVGYVQKTGKMSGGARYTYASEADLINALRPAMTKAQIIAYPAEVTNVEIQQYSTSGGTVMQDRVATIRWFFVHAPSETSISVEVVGEGSDSGDKASNKAMTAAMKYALRQTFLIETGDDPDSERPEYERASPKESNPSVPQGLPKDTQAKSGRMENQWENNVIDTIMDLNLAQARPHAVNRLNHSCLYEKNFGDVKDFEGVAYMLIWNKCKEDGKKMDVDARAKQVNGIYLSNDGKKWIERAVDMIASLE